MNHHTYDDVINAAGLVKDTIGIQPTVGIILGTGQGGFVEHISNPVSTPYQDIPLFPESTVESHAGRLVSGMLDGVPVCVMQGRFHMYEGYSLQQIAYPIRVMWALGVKTLIVCNACGGMNPLYRRGDVMLIDDHINLLGTSPLVGPNDERFGPRFPDMSEPYSQHLLTIAEKGALEGRHRVHRGVFVAVCGPNLETRAEYRFLRTIGADVVGMSTVPEVIAARHLGMKVLGISIITDECFPDSLQPVLLEEMLQAVTIAEPVVADIIRYVVQHADRSE